jgi:MerR family copper efflux transcriptional regulator
MTASRSLTIGQVAARAGVAIDTVRYYERRGVIPPVVRRASGYRAFPAETVERIGFVKELQSLGFNLDEIIGLLKLVDSDAATCGPARERAIAVLDRIDAKLHALSATRRRLASLLEACDAGTCQQLVAEVTPRISVAGPRRPLHRSLRS